MIHNDRRIVLRFEDLISVSHSRSCKIQTTKGLLIRRRFLFLKRHGHIAHTLVLSQFIQRVEQSIPVFELHHQDLGVLFFRGLVGKGDAGVDSQNSLAFLRMNQKAKLLLPNKIDQKGVRLFLTMEEYLQQRAEHTLHATQSLDHQLNLQFHLLLYTPINQNYLSLCLLYQYS
jgi:hypothetical protein